MGEHYVVAVGIHTTASALAPVVIDVMSIAVGHVELGLGHLIAPVDYRRVYLPHEEIVAFQLPRRKLLHGKEERKLTRLPLGVGG